ncbi:MAG: hypothetical protein LLF28_01150 [Nitrospiraceae bacterium]|nr:hypothetical protein [Nitrospiraceae bacterium]
MTYTDAIKKGFNLITNNWQLVFVQIVMMIIIFIGLLVFIGIPLLIALLVFGIDLTELMRLKDFFLTMTSPSKIISKYIGLIIVLAASFVFYLLAITCIWLYALAGTAGILGRAIKDESAKFSLSVFFSEGKRLFFPLLWYSGIIGLVFTAITLFYGIVIGLMIAVINMMKQQGAALSIFLGIFLSLILLTTGIFVLVCTLAATTYGIAEMVFRNTRPLKALKETAKYLYNKPSALWLYFIGFGGYIAASFIIILIGAPFNLIPIIGTIISLPYQLASSIAQTYLWLVLIGAAFIYYFNSTKEMSKIDIVPLAEFIPQVSDTSQFQAPGQELSPPQKEEK